MDQPSLREKHKQKVTQRIVSAAVELFKANGYNQTTVDDIAAHADISRKTFFNYFPSKESLLLPWGQEILDQQVLPEFQNYLRNQPSTMEALRFLFIGMGESIQTFPDAVQAFVREASKPHDDAQMQLIGISLHEFFVPVLRYGQERGEVRADIPLESLARYLMALQTSLFFSLLEPASQTDPVLEVDRLLAFIETGLRPVSGG